MGGIYWVWHPKCVYIAERTERTDMSEAFTMLIMLHLGFYMHIGFEDSRNLQFY